jgi:DNA-binding NarL/FixJ family response regulator
MTAEFPMEASHMAEEIRVVLADDHPTMRKGLRLSLEEDRGLKIVAEASDGEEALAVIRKLHPQIAVLDIDMPKLDGLAVARTLAKDRSETAVIFLTLHADEHLFREAINLGSKGYILKDSATEEIVAGVRAVAAGQPYLSPAVTTYLLQNNERSLASQERKLTDRLTPTEHKIMRLIATGKTSKEIGAELSIHYRTVENHRTNICRKLELEGEGANALLRFALQHKDML